MRNTPTLASLVLLIAQPVVFFYEVLISKRTHLPYDFTGFHLPLIAYVARCAREHVFPFWEPYQYCGMPIHADIQVQLFYPITWIAILLGNLRKGVTLLYWLEWGAVAHIILGGIFLFLLLRRTGCAQGSALLGGTAYELGAYFSSQTQHLGAICAGAWLPLGLWSVWEMRHDCKVRWVCALTLAISLSILAGFAATSFIVCATIVMFAAALWVVRECDPRIFLRIAAAAVGAGVVCLVQLAPTLVLSSLSVASDRAKWFRSGGGLAWQSLASFVVPNYYHVFTPLDKRLFTLPFNFTLLYTYCGLLTALLFVSALFCRSKLARVGFVLALVCTVWMLGQSAGVYNRIYLLIPAAVRGALYPEYALMPFTLFVAFAAAQALQVFSWRRPAWIPWLVALLTAADLTYFGSNRPMNSEPGRYKNENFEDHVKEGGRLDVGLRKLISEAVPPERVDYLDGIFNGGIVASQMIRVPTSDGDNPFALKRVLNVRRLFAGGNWWDRRIPVAKLDSPLLDFLNVGFLAGQIVLSAEDVERGGLEQPERFGGYLVYRRRSVLPRFFLVGQVRHVNTEQEALAYLGSPAFRPAEEAVVEQTGFTTEGDPGAASLAVDHYGTNDIELTVIADRPRLLVTSEPFYPGWKAFVNANETPIIRTNSAFRGIALNAGRSQVRMTYQPAGYFTMAAVSALGAIAATAGLFTRRRCSI